MELRPDIRAARPSDAGAVRALAVATGLLSAEEADELLASAPDADDGAMWLVAVSASEAVVGAACSLLEPVSDGVWNLQLLAVDPAIQRAGVGSALVAEVESALAVRPDRASALLIETSSTDLFAAVRALYAGRGYVEVGRIPDYYGPGDDKVIFWKALAIE